MKDRIELVLEPHRGDDGQFRWPAATDDRNELASRLLGACSVASLDYWVESALDVLRNPEPSPERRRERTDGEQDDQEREVLGALTDEQRRVVETIVLRTAHGIMFSLLTELDQFPGAELDLVAYEPESATHLASVREGDIFDLHDRLGAWVEEFSEYSRELETV